MNRVSKNKLKLRVKQWVNFSVHTWKVTAAKAFHREPNGKSTTTKQFRSIDLSIFDAVSQNDSSRLFSFLDLSYRFIFVFLSTFALSTIRQFTCKSDYSLPASRRFAALATSSRSRLISPSIDCTGTDWFDGFCTPFNAPLKSTVRCWRFIEIEKRIVKWINNIARRRRRKSARKLFTMQQLVLCVNHSEDVLMFRNRLSSNSIQRNAVLLIEVWLVPLFKFTPDYITATDT